MNIINMRPPRIALALALVSSILHLSLNMGEGIRFSRPRLGTTVGITGFLLMMWAWRLFRKQNLAVCPTARTARITTEGPYHFSRNPMYLGMILMMSGLALCIGTLPFYLSALAYFAVLNFVFCPYEENKLATTFGPEYRKYRNRVRRWI